MRFIFFGMDDSLLFVRDDAESATWSVKGMQLNVDFPYIAEKEITRGMRVGFVDEDGILQPFEIRRVKLYEPDHYQEVYAEHIAIAELTDEFYQGSDATDITPDVALETILTGTLWEVGTCTADNVSTVDLDKGTVWNDVRNIEQNWNVWITPRVTFDAHGITGRYLDIVPAVGVWRGVTLSINGNADEMGVTVDDSETVTAVYGLGGTPPTKSGTASDAITFAEVVWEATEDHPAKPSGQTYIEDPAALALYGRNGRNRFSYYQNGDIKTPELLLQKSWEYLQTVNKPRVTVECVMRDLKRMGYGGEGIRIHDKVQVRIMPVGQILVLDVDDLEADLLDPTATRPTIGRYIPNIVYINRETNQYATGGGRGGGETNNENALRVFDTQIYYNSNEISLEAYQRAYQDGQLSASLLDAWASINIEASNITGLVAGAGAQLDEDGRLIVDSHGFPVFSNQNPASMYSRIQQTASGVETIVSGVSAGTFNDHTAYTKDTYVLYNNKLYRFTSNHASGPWTGLDAEEVTELFSQVTQNSEEIQTKVSNGTFASYVTQTANKISLVVGGTDANPEVNSASIVAAINGNGDSSVKIDANHIVLNGAAVAASLTSETITCDGLEVGDATIDNEGGISCSSIDINGSTLDGSFDDWIVDASVDTSTNTLTLTKFDGSTVTFSRAAKFSGAWNGSGTYSVTADPNGVTSLSITPGIRLAGSGGTSFTGQLATDGTFASVQRSVSGYLYSAGTGFVGVYTQYSGGAYSGLIAQYPIPATSRAEIVTASASASGNDIDVDVDIGIKATTPGGIDEVWSQDSFTLSNALEDKAVTLSSSADQVIVPTTSGCVGLSSVTVPMVNLKAETFSANGTYSVPTGYDGYGTVEVSVGSGGSYAFSCTEQAATWTQSISGYLSCGAISKSGISANTYLRFRIKCDNAYQYCYLTVNP